MDVHCVLIIPAYKPDMTLVHIVADLSQSFKYIVIVDDGSGKEYRSIFEELENIFNERESCRVIRHYTNLGKGRAIKSALNYCLGLISKGVALSGVITVDADGQHSVPDVVKCAQALELQKNKLILGCRDFHAPHIPFRSRFGNTVTRIIFRWLCGISLSDTQTGLRGIPVSFLEKCCTIEGERYQYETNMLIVAKRENVCFYEEKIETIYEPGNPTSHFNPLLDSLAIYRVIASYSLSSLFASLVDYVIFTICTGGGVSVLAANYIGRAVSAIVNYNVNKKLVFKSNSKSFMPLLKYVALLIASGTTSALLIMFFEKIFAIEIYLIKIVAEVVLYFINYYIQNIFIFGKKDHGNETH